MQIYKENIYLPSFLRKKMQKNSKNLHNCLEELDIALHLHHISGGRKGHRLTLPECVGITTRSENRPLALDCDENHEGVEFGVVERHRFGEVIHCRCEKGTRHKRCCLVLHGCIIRAVVVEHCIVDSFGSLLGMQLTVIAVLVLEIIIVDTISDIAGLLYFGNK